jgi:hypothetical protein
VKLFSAELPHKAQFPQIASSICLHTDFSLALHSITLQNLQSQISLNTQTMDILGKLTRLSGMSETKHQPTTPAKSHSRKPSYEEVKTPGTIDYIVALCAGSKAGLVL